MKSIITSLLFAMGILWHFTVNSQTFVKVTNSPINESIEAIGTSWGDFDDDGDLDIFLNTWTSSINNVMGYGKLFQNNCNGDFTRITAMPGDILKDVGTWGSGASWIDIENDGDADLYIAHNDGLNNALYINNGDGSFTKQTLLNIVNDGSYTRGHVWADLNNDGFLDLFLGNDGGSGIKQNDMVFLSDGYGGYIPTTSGDIVNDNARSQNVDAADFDNDGDMDLFVGTVNNFQNLFYKNNGDGTFSKIIEPPFTTDNSMSWSISFVDFDNDLDLDIFVHNSFGIPNRLYRNNGDGTFTSITNDPLVLNTTHNNGGETWGDYDNDGDLDVFVSDFYMNQLYNNNGDGTFTPVTNEIVANDTVSESYGATWCDYDKDGDLDLFVPNAFSTIPNFFYINTYQNNGNNNHWINIKCIGETSNKSAIGARIYVKATINGQPSWQMREINANHSTCQGGMNPMNQHFGLGDATIIDSLKIFWPKSNTLQVFTNVLPDRYIEILENDDYISEGKKCNADLPPTNVGFVSGRVYQDENDNCIFDPGVDYPVSNVIVKALPGPYFVLTDEDGNYTFKLEEGVFTIGLANENDSLREIHSCMLDSTYTVQVIVDSSSINNDFTLKKPPIICDVDISTTFVGIEECAPGVTYTTPCPSLCHYYIYTIINNSTIQIPAGSILSVELSPGMNFNAAAGITCGGIWAPFVGPTATVTFPNPIPVGGICSVTLFVCVDLLASSPFVSTAEFSVPTGIGPNIIINGNFELGNVGFASDYDLGCLQEARYEISPGSINAPLPPCLNPNHRGLDFTPAPGVNFLYADGSVDNTLDVWREVLPVTIGQTYTFVAWYNNVSFQNSTYDPSMRFFVGNNPVGGVIDVPMTPDIWIPFSANFVPATSPITLRIRSITGQSMGNDFGIDEISCFRSNCFGVVFDQFVQEEACSCDPNDKLVNPIGCGPEGNINKNDVIKYTIRFQNTGYSPAHNVIVKDYLDKNLDLSTLKILGSSHYITYSQILPDSSLIIYFENIELPDSLSDPDGSFGYVTFIIYPKSGLPNGTVIYNKAGIYFDDNDVVITNITKNTLFDQPEPDAHFSFEHTCNSTSVFNFNYTGNTPDNATYLWNFGENAMPQTSTEQNPSEVVFTNVDITNIVTLTVYRNGCESTTIDTLVIEDVSCGKNKVLVCHNGHTICISKNALPAHLAHGDCIGSCNIIKKSLKDNRFGTNGMLFNLYPNPAKDEVVFNYLVPNDNEVSISIYNYLGQKVAELQDVAIGGESYSVPMSIRKLPEGIYIVLFKTNENFETSKLYIIK